MTNRHRSMASSRDRPWKIASAVAITAVVAFVAGAVYVHMTRETQSPYETTPLATTPTTSIQATTASPTTTPEIQTPRPIVAFIGDSYTQGAGAEPADRKWTSQLAASMNWDERNFGLGGTGYLTTAGIEACGLPECANYQTTALEAIAANPAIVVVSGGQNDASAYEADPTLVQAAIAATFIEIRTALPEVQIIAVGPSTPTQPTESILGLASDVRDTATAFGGQYISLLDPNVIGPADVLPDGEHVNNNGHTYISERVRQAIS